MRRPGDKNTAPFWGAQLAQHTVGGSRETGWRRDQGLGHTGNAKIELFPENSREGF